MLRFHARTCAIGLTLLTVSTLPLRGQASTRTGVPPGAIVLSHRGQERTLSAAELARLPRQTLRIAGEAGDSTPVSGVALWDVLQLAGVPAREASGRQRAVMTVRLTGADGQSAMLALVEVDPGFSRRPALLADRRGDRPLDAVEGPWRAILPEDLRHARWIRGVVTITVSGDAP